MAEQKAGGFSTKYRFTGKEQDAFTGLQYFGARYYDARISLWYGVDPMTEKMPNWNPYRYGFNNPIRLIDPTGMSEEEADGIENEYVRYKNEEGKWVTKQISNKGGDDRDIIHTINGKIPEKGSSITTETIENKTWGNRNAPGDFSLNPMVTDKPLSDGDMLDLSDLIPTKAATVGETKLGLKIIVLGVVKEGFEEGGEITFKKMAKPGILKPGNNQVQNSQFKKLIKELNLTKKESEEMHGN